MTLQLVTADNIDKQVFKNIRTVLLNNTHSAKVAPTLSEKAKLPIITLETNSKQVKKKIGRTGSDVFVSTINIVCYGTSYEKSNDIMNECKELLKTTYESDLSSNNMDLYDYNINNNNISRGGNIIRGRTINVQYVIR